MWECLALPLLVVLCVPARVHGAATSHSVDDWREDLFLPGLKAQYLRDSGKLPNSFESALRKNQREQEKQTANASAAVDDGEDTGTGSKISGLLEPADSDVGTKFAPRHEAWTYYAAFGASCMCALLLVAYNVRRSRLGGNRDEEGGDVVHYSRLQGDNRWQDRDASPPGRKACSSLRLCEASDLDAERLVLQPLLEQAMLGSPRRSGRERSSHSARKAATRDPRDRPVVRSLWSKIMRSSRDIFVPEQFVSGSTVKGPAAHVTPNHAMTVSTLPTITSRVESLQDMTEVEKTLWWRTM